MEVHDKTEELTKIANDKKIFENKLGELFKVCCEKDFAFHSFNLLINTKQINPIFEKLAKLIMIISISCSRNYC